MKKNVFKDGNNYFYRWKDEEEKIAQERALNLQSTEHTHISAPAVASSSASASTSGSSSSAHQPNAVSSASRGLNQSVGKKIGS